MNNINYEDFKNICRICMCNCDINFNKNSVVMDIFYKLTDVQFETNNELPEQICFKCVDFINEIHAFSITCKQTHSALINCLTNYKNIRIKEEQEIIEETNEQINIKDEVNIEEHKIEFIKVELDNELETNALLSKDVAESTNDILPPVSTYIQTENEDDPLNIINSNDLNKGSYLSDSERPNKCDQCEKSFTKLSDLIRHKRVHSGERAFKCDQCEKSFTRFDQLKIHKRVHSGERLYKCDQCEKSFNTSSDLIRHKRVHTGERPYKCDQCDKSFTHSNVLLRHKRVHTEKRPYKCDLCEKSYIQLSHLKDHKHVHTGDRPYKCDLCEKSFTRLGFLKNHKRLHSSEVK